ncbi:aminotransferase class V-fold PLP-dependent enzyme [Terriglobus albidus]|uniref:aminotransferase class V-fold PLP-dependent enzyme n=1 Tax=Terriglobus albidus TaxID=1592106 RepID=UPI0021E09CCD|nr:aminotransferase class V-fold PLP-dependent enzyme [Terriglobus albidus]
MPYIAGMAQHDRRSFLKMTALAGAFSSNSFFQQAHAEEWQAAAGAVNHHDAATVAQNEDFWSVIQRGYSVSPLILNLNNGGVSPAPIVVQEAVARYNQMTNEGPSYFMWQILDQGREPLRQKLARLAGASAEEIAINRNATEALNTIIYGLPLKAGDEVVGCKFDYPNMMNAYRQRAERDGIVYKQVTFKFPVEDVDAIVKTYEQAMTPRTKLVHITHVVNWVGQIMPVQQIADMGHAHGAEVIVDGAHSFGLLDFKIPDLHCEYFGTSLHKFLSAPIGSGMMWVKQEKIAKLWPLTCYGDPHSPNIRKFEALGTRSFPIEQGIGEAINFHEGIGPRRKQERIHYLKSYWATRVREIKGVTLHTSLDPRFSCAICGVSVEGYTPTELMNALFDRYKIHTVGIDYEGVRCIRVTPHVYTTLADLDRFVNAIGELAAGKKA